MFPLALASCIALADPADVAFDAAAELERSGRPEAALDLLAPLLDEWPQDYAVAIEVARRALALGEYALAERAYRRALELSDGNPESRLGLAWALTGLGDRREARALAEGLDRADPRVEALFDALARPVWWAVRVGADVLGVPPAATAIAADAAIELRGRHVSAGVASVARAYAPFDLRVAEGGSGSLTPEEVEAWARLGAGGEHLGAEVVGAVLTRSGASPGGVVGVFARANADSGFRFTTQASWTRPRGATLDVWRVVPAAWVPIGRAAVQPFGALQVVDGAVLGGGGGTLWWAPTTWSVWVGGKLGDERLATDIALPYANPWDGVVVGGAWLGLRLGAVDGSWLALEAAVEWVDVGGAPTPFGIATATVQAARRPR